MAAQTNCEVHFPVDSRPFTPAAKSGSAKTNGIARCHHETTAGDHESHCLGPRPRLTPQCLRLITSYVFMLTVSLMTSMVVVLAHNRASTVGRVAGHDPLPDLILDHVPRIPWGFDLCEVLMLSLLAMFLTILALHRHRTVVLRRFFLLLGSIFLLRCITMLTTTLPVPGPEFICEPFPDSVWVEVAQALTIWKQLGMKTQGTPKTCGDLMFSGHTTIVTLLNYFILEYSPGNWRWVHLTTWTMNLTAMFFILAGHEHYTMDVVVAYFITSRMFLYYHTLVNVCPQCHSYPRKMWFTFPAFSFMESGDFGGVHNDYEWPFSWSPSSLCYYIKKL